MQVVANAMSWGFDGVGRVEEERGEMTWRMMTDGMGSTCS